MSGAESVRRVRILMVDDDPTQRELVPYLLAKQGREFLVAKDGAEGLEMALAQRPDIIILDVQMPRMDGFALLKRLRATVDLALTPVIFLTGVDDDEDRRYGFRLGADAFIAKSTLRERSAHELSEQIDDALARGRMLASSMLDLGDVAEVGSAVASERAPEPALRGSIAQIGVPSLLTIFEMEKKSGEMRIESADNVVAHIYLCDGRIVAAEVEGMKGAGNVAALARILTWTDGTFELNVHPVGRNDEIEESTSSLLMSAAQLLDESQR